LFVRFEKGFYFVAESFIFAAFLIEEGAAFVGIEIDRGLEYFLHASPALTGQAHLLLRLATNS
jgi:hypothetical protein